MGCDLDISIITDRGNPQEYFERCFFELQRYESIFSRFDEQSELSLLNQEKRLKVSETFFHIFLEAKKLVDKSNGIFNPLSQVEQFGYSTDFSEKENFKKNKELTYNDDFSSIIFDRENRIIQLQENQKLDFGGFLKGYCAQKISEKLSHFHGSLVNIGGDIYGQGFDADDEEFSCSIYNPLTDKDIFDIPLNNKSLSTSGTYKRHWESDGEIISHIINTQKRESANSDIISASIISIDAAQSDAWATLAVILGSHATQKFLDTKKDIHYILITRKGFIVHNLSIL